MSLGYFHLNRHKLTLHSLSKQTRLVKLYIFLAKISSFFTPILKSTTPTA
ncbi:hypothetical protein SPONN_1696 [uncultured Candidatus Thioglobus sp.]|nr:hypothetical protein SPONN_1696 [uncultured Candidatus Thioglobus sp.]